MLPAKKIARYWLLRMDASVDAVSPEAVGTACRVVKQAMHATSVLIVVSRLPL